MMHTCSNIGNAVAKDGGSNVAHRVHNSSIDIAHHRATTVAAQVLQRCAHTATPGAESVHLRCIPQCITIATNVTASANLRCRHCESVVAHWRQAYEFTHISVFFQTVNKRVFQTALTHRQCRSCIAIVPNSVTPTDSNPRYGQPHQLASASVRQSTPRHYFVVAIRCITCFAFSAVSVSEATRWARIHSSSSAFSK